MEKTGSKLIDKSDLELVELASRGNQAAFLVIYERYNLGVFAHICNYLTQREEAEDVMLESFQKAFAQIDSYNPEFKFTTWIYKIARNTALDHLDKIGRQTANMPVDSIEKSSGIDVPTPEASPESAVISGEETDKLVAIVNGLSITYREVARLVLLDNYGYQEAADALGLPLNTVKTRVRRARAEILSKLEDNEEDEQ